MTIGDTVDDQVTDHRQGGHMPVRLRQRHLAPAQAEQPVRSTGTPGFPQGVGVDRPHGEALHRHDR